MKKIIVLILIVTSINIFGQIEPSVTFDPVTGYYLCKYQIEDKVYEVIFEPRTNIQPGINAKVLFNADSSYFEYNYEVFNSSTSIQRISKIAIEYLSPISNIEKPDSLWYRGFYSFVPLVDWDNITNPTGFASKNDGVAQGTTLGGFGFSSSGLPTIVKGYFYGNNTIPLAFPGEGDARIEKLLEPLTRFPNDCIVKKTIGPKDLPDPFIPTEFIDTLITYADSSYALCWITNEQTRDKYDNYFNNVKNYLNQNNNNAAKSELQKVLTDCNTDSSSVLTSEAYALLYFNTDYLIKQIPEGEPGLPVKLEDSQGNLLPVPSGDGGNVKYYASGWKDFGDAVNGEVTKELLPREYSFRMNYGGASIDQKQDIGVDENGNCVNLTTGDLREIITSNSSRAPIKEGEHYHIFVIQ